MAYLSKKAKWIFIILAILLALSVFSYRQAMQEKEELQDYWLTNTVNSINSQLARFPDRMERILTEQELDEADFVVVAYQLRGASIDASSLSTSIYSPQPEMWNKLSLFLDDASLGVGAVLSEYVETGRLSQENLDRLQEVETLTQGIIDIFRSEYNHNEGTVTEEGIERIHEVTSNYERITSDEVLE